jgi:undecaprenyl-diphosphatase
MVLGVISSLFLAYLFFDISTEIIEKDTIIIDRAISYFIYGLRTPPLTQIMIFITNFGAQYTLVGLAFVVVFLFWKHRRQYALFFLIVSAMGLFINISLKELFHRPRPSMSPLINASSFSFPSGHAMNSFVFFATLCFYFYHFTKNKKASVIVAIFSLFLILLIGFSRVYLGVHYPTDILAGYCIGFWWFITAILIEKSVTFSRVYRQFVDSKNSSNLK